MPDPIPEFEDLTPEDDYFARVALYNKLVTEKQVAVCAQLIAKVAKESGVRHSLASVLIHRGYITAEHAAAVQKAVKQYAASQAKATKAAEAAERKASAEQEKPTAPEAAAALLGTGSFRKRAKAGESQVLVRVKASAPREDKRMHLNVETGRGAATLVVGCTALYAEDTPAFEAACRRLIEAEQPEIFIDMTRVKRVPSLLFGELTKATNAAQAAGRSLTVILNRETGRVARMILGDLVKVKVR